LPVLSHGLDRSDPVDNLLGILLVNRARAFSPVSPFVLVIPIQTRLMRLLPLFHQRTMIFTDKRAKLLQELLSSIKIIKFFAWEDPYLARIQQVREPETRSVSLNSNTK
jgi:hypothetical protein